MKSSEQIFINLTTQIVSWEPEGCYQYSKIFCWEPEGLYRWTKSMVVAPFWFSIEYLWIVLAPFWLSTDKIYNFLNVADFGNKLLFLSCLVIG